MKSQKKLIYGAFILMFLLIGNVSAQTCYDPYYGYYDCGQYYYYPDQGQALMEGAFMGLIVGGLLNNRDYYRHGNWNGHHGNWEGHQGWGRGDHWHDHH